MATVRFPRKRTLPKNKTLPGGGPSASVGYSSKLEVSRWFWIFGVIGGWMVRLRRPSQLKPSNHLKQMKCWWALYFGKWHDPWFRGESSWTVVKTVGAGFKESFFVNAGEGGRGLLRLKRYQTVWKTYFSIVLLTLYKREFLKVIQYKRNCCSYMLI